MNTVYLILAVGMVVLLAGAVLVVLLSSGAKSQERRLRDAHTRHIARQPWDAQSAEGRGNR